MIGKYDSDFDDSSSADDERKASSGEFEWEEIGEKGLERTGQDQTEEKVNPFEEEGAREEKKIVQGMEGNEGRIQSEKEEMELPVCEDSLVRIVVSSFPSVNLLSDIRLIMSCFLW